MDHPFPPSAASSLTAILWHVVMLGLGVAAVVSVFRAEYRPARPWSWVPWLAAVLAVFCLLVPLATNAPEPLVPFIGGYGIFVLIVAGTGLVRSFIRLWRREPTGSAWASITAMIVLGVIIFCLLPGVPNARETARRTVCKGHFKKLVVAAYEWEVRSGRLPDAVFAEDAKPPRSWRVELLPYLEYSALRSAYEDTIAWDAPRNEAVGRHRMELYVCPANPTPQAANGRYYTAAAFVTGPQTCFPEDHGVLLKDVTDGVSRTILIAEACGQNIIWTEPRDLHVSQLPVGVNLPGDRRGASHGLMSSYHPGVVNVAMADGSCMTLSEKIDPDVLRKMTTASGHEVILDNEF
jgi:prepilin-type processing-associated H-X9-DG protein